MKRLLIISAVMLCACTGNQSQLQPLTVQQQQAIVQAACVATVAAEAIHGVASDVSADTATACTAAGTVVTTLPALAPAPASGVPAK